MPFRVIYIRLLASPKPNLNNTQKKPYGTSTNTKKKRVLDERHFGVTSVGVGGWKRNRVSTIILELIVLQRKNAR